jgi:hypothetical protein
LKEIKIYKVGMASNIIKFIPNFINNGPMVWKVKEELNRQHSDIISGKKESKESRLKIPHLMFCSRA